MTINQPDLSSLQSSAHGTDHYDIHKDNLEKEAPLSPVNVVDESSMDVGEDSVDITHLRTPIKVDLSPIYNFLGARTTQAWVDAAIDNLPLIIQDHANCEKKSRWHCDEFDISVWVLLWFAT